MNPDNALISICWNVIHILKKINWNVNTDLMFKISIPLINHLVTRLTSNLSLQIKLETCYYFG